MDQGGFGTDVRGAHRGGHPATHHHGLSLPENQEVAAGSSPEAKAAATKVVPGSQATLGQAAPRSTVLLGFLRISILLTPGMARTQAHGGRGRC